MIKEFYNKSSGFTLVELLVVIAIIGLLSTIVLVSFGPIRNSAKDVAIKANISQMRLAMEMHFSEKGKYTDGAGRADFSAAKEAAIAAGATVTVHVADGIYCTSATLQGEDGSWCINDTGFIGKGNCTTEGNDAGKCLP